MRCKTVPSVPSSSTLISEKPRFSVEEEIDEPRLYAASDVLRSGFTVAKNVLPETGPRVASLPYVCISQTSGNPS